MPELSLQNIERISRDVKRQEIIFSHLADDLIDHICCDVENAMEDGLTFYEAYMKVKQKMNPRRLKEIQEETLYAIDTKYRNMKNTMKISGVAGATLFGLAALFKIQHWPGATEMLTIGLCTEAVIFFFSAFEPLHEEVDWTLVYPELAGIPEEGGELPSHGKYHGVAQGGGGGFVGGGGGAGGGPDIQELPGRDPDGNGAGLPDGVRLHDRGDHDRHPDRLLCCHRHHHDRGCQHHGNDG